MGKVKVAVIGAGVFGCTIALDLARKGAQVDLYEAGFDILEGATARCQGRLHSGYHYPRSPATAMSAKLGVIEFMERYPEGIVRDIPQYYAIAPNSKVSVEDYLQFCKELSLPYQIEKPAQLRGVDLCIRVPELFIDANRLRRSLRRDLIASGVNVILQQRVTADNVLEYGAYDQTVWTTYGEGWEDPLQFEVCEVPVLEIGRYPRQSVVILDGDFGGIDARGKIHSLYHVKHTVRWSWTGTGTPPIPPEYRDKINRAPMPLQCRSGSNLDAMIESLGEFFWALHPGSQGVSIYHGSLWSVRAVLPTVEDTDDRPTIVRRSGAHIRVLSGKICTATLAGRQVTEMVMEA